MLPLRILSRAFDIEQCLPADIDLLFNFLLWCLNHFSRTASILLEGFDISLLMCCGKLDAFQKVGNVLPDAHK
jgi:hypothetical protein